MKKVLITILSLLKLFSFWGILFLLVLVLGFKIRIMDIIQTALGPISAVSMYCAFMLLSIILFPLIAIITILRSEAVLFDTIAMDFLPLVWVPYKGFIFRYFSRLKAPWYDDETRKDDLKVHVWRLIYTILWWFVIVLGIVVIRTKENVISQTIKSCPPTERLYIIAIFIGCYLLILLIAKLLYRIMMNSIKKAFNTTPSKNGTKSQRYYERHPDKIPFACKACGGPYPECRTSCNLYDE